MKWEIIWVCVSAFVRSLLNFSLQILISKYGSKISSLRILLCSSAFPSPTVAARLRYCEKQKKKRKHQFLREWKGILCLTCPKTGPSGSDRLVGASGSGSGGSRNPPHPIVHRPHIAVHGSSRNGGLYGLSEIEVEEAGIGEHRKIILERQAVVNQLRLCRQYRRT
jgi:hypothetical protein